LWKFTILLSKTVYLCHRSAKLSEGQVTDGRLECLYHGWQFEGSGACTKIPQVPYLSTSMSISISISKGMNSLQC
jgi:nitrite reductase/ring-hydroxylating ferredoxin subunit